VTSNVFNAFIAEDYSGKIISLEINNVKYTLTADKALDLGVLLITLAAEIGLTPFKPKKKKIKKTLPVHTNCDCYSGDW